MNCKNCKTQIPPREKMCPNCGRRGKGRAPAAPEAGASGDTLAGSQPKLSLQDVAEVDLDQVLDRGPFDLAVAPTPSDLRGMLAAQPRLLEPGFELHESDSGSVGLRTEVGEIDLVLVGGKGGLFVVLIPEKMDPATAIFEILPRMGYIARKEKRASGEVRGIVLLPRLPEAMDYAAAAVADRVSFYTYRTAVRFDRMEVGELA
ncbi:MAG: hypothetical protein VX574_00435 [Myxococcota bacterium]|nr:hypothetical protein [Myxococcota bacterium]